MRTRDVLIFSIVVIMVVGALLTATSMDLTTPAGITRAAGGGGAGKGRGKPYRAYQKAPVDVAAAVAAFHPNDSIARQVFAIECPPRVQLSEAYANARSKYNQLLESYGPDRPLHEYSYYQLSLENWDRILKSHVEMLGYQPGEWLFESGSAAGAALDAVARQFGVNIAGVDIAEELVDLASDRLPHGKFCAASATDLSFIPSNLFHHSAAMGVYTYLDNVVDMCEATKELLRIVRPGGTVFMGQINDHGRESLRPAQAEGNTAVGPLYWYRFAHDAGIEDVRVLRAGEVYSKRKVPDMDTYDLHATIRYNVYLRKPLTPLHFGALDCHAVESNLVTPRITVNNLTCHLPFYYKNILFDDCTTADSDSEWCSTVPRLSLEQSKEPAANTTAWGFCKPLPYKVRKDFWGKE